MIPTVRVAHPVLGFVTINAVDFDAQRHELHGEQAEGFDPAHLHHPAASLDPAVRDAAAALCMRMVALRRRHTGEPFADLPPPDQLAVLNDLSTEFARAEAEFEEDQRERAAFEADERARQAQEGAQERQDGGEASSGAGVPVPTPAPAIGALRVGKGPRGLWFVFRGEERASKGYLDQVEAETEARRLVQAEHAAAQDAAR